MRGGVEDGVEEGGAWEGEVGGLEGGEEEGEDGGGWCVGVGIHFFFWWVGLRWVWEVR